MRQTVVTIPISILNVAIEKLTPIQCKKLIAAILCRFNGYDFEDYLDTSVSIILDMYSDFVDQQKSRSKSLSESRRAAANARWQKNEDEPVQTEVAIPFEPVQEVIIEKVEEEPAKKTPSFVPNDSFLEGSPVRDQFLRWIDYKKKRRSPYNTQMSYEQCHNKLMKMSSGNPYIAEQIVDNSISNSYLGIFPLKNNQNGFTNKFERQERAEQQLISSVAQQCSDNIRQEQSHIRGGSEGGFVPKSI